MCYNIYNKKNKGVRDMRGLVNMYEKAIKELEARIEFYAKENNKEKVAFLTGKKEALEEVLNGQKINYYYE
jgi:predicted ATP-grasp superfamily ATP-dependent carboligase